MQKNRTLRKLFNFIAKHKNILFSIVLIFVIPFVLILNTFYNLKKFENFNNKYLETKRSNELLNLLEIIIRTNYYGDFKRIDNIFKEIVEKNQFIDSVNLIEVSDKEFFIVSSSNSKEKSKKIEEENLKEQFMLALSLKRPFIRELTLYNDNLKNYIDYYFIVKPINLQDKEFLINILFNLEEINLLKKDIERNSLILLFISLILVVLLIVNHTELFGYVSLARRLEEVNQMKNEFISVATHELRSPVSALKGYLDLIKEGVFGKISKDLNEAILNIEKITNNLSNLVEDLLEVSRIESGRIKLQIKEVNPEVIFKKVYESFKAEALSKGLNFNLEIKSKDVPKIKVDEGRLEEILSNLVSNALKYTLKGGIDMILEYNSSKKEIWFKVKDTGIGIPPEQQKFMFTKFYRVKDPRTRHTTGTGLGLWITKNLTELMGGKLYFQSIKDVGSEFSAVFKAIK